MTQDHSASPLNPLPAAVWLMVLAILGVELVVQAGAHGFAGGPQALGWRLDAVQRFGFTGTVQQWMFDNRTFPAVHLIRYLTFSFIHAGALHVLFVLVFVLALGKMVGEAFGFWGLWVVFLGSAASGALVYGFAFASTAWLIGGYPGVFGLVGAFTFLIWLNLAGAGIRRLRAFALIGVLLALRLVFGLMVGLGDGWLADVTGFATGFALSFLVAPGAWPRVLARLRNR